MISGVFAFLDITSRVDAVENYKHSESIWVQAWGWLLTTPPWVPSSVFFILLGFVLWEYLVPSKLKSIPLHPLDIVFDSQNPGDKFYSIEPARDKDGKPLTHSYWEYRVIVKNLTEKTIRNVSLTVEAIGMLPKRPEQSRFDINRQHSLDIHPGEEKLAVLTWWYNPPIMAGLALGPGVYGPIKATVHADDTLPLTRVFGFEPSLHPMIYEIEPPRLFHRRVTIKAREWLPQRSQD